MAVAAHDLEAHTFDVLADTRQSALRLLSSEVLLAHERDGVRDVLRRIDQTIALKHERGNIDKELEGSRERWADWNFRREDNQWLADSKDGMCRIRSSSIPALEDLVRQEEDIWSRVNRGRRPPLSERLRFAEANRGSRYFTRGPGGKEA